MFLFNSITITYPYAFLIFIFFPVFWKILRTLPLSPKLIKFPAIKIIANEQSIDQSPAKLSYPIVLLRLLILTFIIFAISQPIINKQDSSPKNYLIILDNSWISSTTWNKKIEDIKNLISTNESIKNKYSIITTTEYDKNKVFKLFNKNSDEIKKILFSLKPLSWNPNYDLIRNELIGLDEKFDSIYWFTEKVVNKQKISLIENIGERNLKVVASSETLIPPILKLRKRGDEEYEFEITHPLNIFSKGTIDCYDLKKRLLYRIDYESESKKNEDKFITKVKATIPISIKNKIGFFQMSNQKSPVSVVLLSESNRKKNIGITRYGNQGIQSEFAGGNYYVKKALEKNYNIWEGSLEKLLNEEIQIIFIDDLYTVKSNLESKLLTWISNGGTLIKFGGEKLANDISNESFNTINDYLSLTGEIVDLNNKLSIKKTMKVSEIESLSPFYGLEISNEVEVKKYLQTRSNLSKDELDIWMKLENGTPLVSSFPYSKGRLIFFHLPLNNSWSNFSLSYSFLDILERIVGQTKGINSKKDRFLKPYLTLGGFGDLQKPSSQNLSLKNFNENKEIKINYFHPPGLYKDSDGIISLNMSNHLDQTFKLYKFDDNYISEIIDTDKSKSLMPILLMISILLFMIETFITLFQRQLIIFDKKLLLRRFIFLFIIIYSNFSIAATDKYIPEYMENRIGYILSGNEQIDNLSENGLNVISRFVSAKTASIFDTPKSIALDKDNLYFYPLIYWPIISNLNEIKVEEKKKIESFIEDGGLLLIDCNIEKSSLEFSMCFRNIEFFFRTMQISKFTLLNNKNPISKSFYLLNSFPGRRNNDVYVAYNNSKSTDNAASIILGDNYWAEAWAKDEQNRYIFPLLENMENQRLLSLRFGLNLIIYALTGNYKTDQVHIPEILKRMDK
ncbi:DUF4159 domain-containing protein [Rickettsiales bacterium]|nr:DUF4159 domain-containing protein [Rickettsiales bacterium]